MVHAQKQSLKVSSPEETRVNQQTKNLLELIEQQKDQSPGEFSASARVEGQHYFTQFSESENLENSTLFVGHLEGHKKYTGPLGLGFHGDVTGGTF